MMKNVMQRYDDFGSQLDDLDDLITEVLQQVPRHLSS